MYVLPGSRLAEIFTSPVNRIAHYGRGIASEMLSGVECRNKLCTLTNAYRDRTLQYKEDDRHFELVMSAWFKSRS